MEKSEPTFIPEWLKGSGGGTTNHQMVSSSLHSDDHLAAKNSRNKSSAGVNDNGIGRSFVSDRTTSSYFRRSSSNNGSSHSRSHGTFGRSNRDRDWEKEAIDSRGKEKHLLSDHRLEYSDLLGSILPGRIDKDLRRTQSMITGKRGETLPRKMPSFSGNTNKSSGLQPGVSALGNVHKASFERDFPSLGSEERQASEIRRVSSPGLSSAIPSMSLAASALTRGDTWTSALAEVPLLAVSNENGSVQQATTPVTVSLSSSMLTGLNMAETVAQGSSRVQTPPELSTETQRLEELAIKQSKQLIPVTPSMPKALVLNSSEKSKAKVGVQQILSPRISSHSPRSAPTTPDHSKLPSVGKLQILKPTRERNGTLPYSKDSSSPTSISTALPSTTLAVGPAPSKSPSEKKLNPQARSRNEFFDLMRKKSISSPSSIPADPVVVSFNSVDNQTANSPVMSQDGDYPVLGSSFGDDSSKGSDDKCNGSSSEKPTESLSDKVFESVSSGKDHSSSHAILPSEEEEAAFLRSLGWEENGGEDEGLTEEEISSFFKDVDEYIKVRPPSKILQAMQPKFLESLNLRNGNVGGGASCGSGSSDSKSDS